MLTKSFLYDFIRRHELAVISSVCANKPQSAVVGIAVTENFELIFDTVKSSRKYANIVQNSRVSAVIGWDDETTVQYEGIARELSMADDHLREIYFSKFPGGRKRAAEWLGLVHFVITPDWIRYSNFNDPQIIEEMTF